MYFMGSEFFLLIVISFAATTAEDDSHESPTKSNTALPFSFWDKLPFLTKEFSSYEPIPHDERFLKELVFNDKEICPKPSFEEIIFNKKCFTFQPSLSGKDTPLFTQTMSRKLYCNPILRNISEPSSVKILNSTDLLELLGKNGSNSNHCTVVLFYAIWCVFSMRMAPAYNALARAFPMLDVVAIDAYNFGQLNSRFGSLSVPTVMVFHNGKAISKFNGTQRTLESFHVYVTNITGMKPLSSVSIQDSDYEGPLPSQLSQDVDYALWLSWIFIFVCILGSIIKSEKGIQFYAALKDLLTHQAGVPHHID